MYLVFVTRIDYNLQLCHSVRVEGVDQLQVGVAQRSDVFVDHWACVLGQDQVLFGSVSGNDKRHLGKNEKIFFYTN